MGGNVVGDFVESDVVEERFVAVWVEVVGPDEAFLLAGWDGKGPNACCHVAYGLAFLEDVAYALVLGVQACVPVDLGKVELEGAALLVDLDVQVVFAVEDLVLEGAEGVLATDGVELVDDRLDHGVLVGEHGGDEVLVGEVALAQVQVGDMAGEGEALGDLVVVLLLGWGNGCARDLGVGEVVVVEVQLEGNDAEGAVLLEVAQLRAPGSAICLPFRLSTSRCRRWCRMGPRTYRRA